jgi:hypothetical protein
MSKHFQGGLHSRYQFKSLRDARERRATAMRCVFVACFTPASMSSNLPDSACGPVAGAHIMSTFRPAGHDRLDGSMCGTYPSELTHRRLEAFLPQFVVISKTAGAVEIDQRALGGRSRRSKAGSGGSQFTTGSTLTDRTLVKCPKRLKNNVALPIASRGTSAVTMTSPKSKCCCDVGLVRYFS